MAGRKFMRGLQMMLVVGIGVCSEDHGAVRNSRPIRVLARTGATVFHTNANSHDSDRGRDYDRGD